MFVHFTTLVTDTILGLIFRSIILDNVWYFISPDCLLFHIYQKEKALSNTVLGSQLRLFCAFNALRMYKYTKEEKGLKKNVSLVISLESYNVKLTK